MGRILMSGAGNVTTTVTAPGSDRTLRNITSSGATAAEVATRRSSGFNPILAVVVSAMIISVFVVGFASGHLRRWIWGYEDEASHAAEVMRRRRMHALHRNHASSSKSQRGLDPEIVAAIPLVRFKDLSSAEHAGTSTKSHFDCSVCLAEFDATDTLKLLPLCAHTFHSDCIDEWFRSHSTCPLCRLSLAPPSAKPKSPGSRRSSADHVDPGHPNIDSDHVNSTPQLESHHELSTAVGPSAGDQMVQAGDDPCSMQLCRVDAGEAPYSTFVPSIRLAVAPARAALASMIRRSYSVGTDLQLAPGHAGYVVDSEGTQHHRSFQAHVGATHVDDHVGASTEITSSKACRTCSRTCAWCTRRSFPNLRQIEPFNVFQVT